MPSIARIIGWCLVMGFAAPLAAQNAAISLPPQGSWREASPRGGQGGDARSAALPPVDPFARDEPAAPAPERAGPAPEVVLTQYVSPPPVEAPPSPRAAAPRTALPGAYVALSRPDKAASLPLPPPSRASGDVTAKAPGGVPSLVTAAGSLAIVLGLFLLLAWFIRRKNPAANTVLPQEVVEVLGRAPLSGRQQLHLLRCGRKLLLVSVTPAGAETLTEITEPTEVDRLAGLCVQSRPNSATAAFRQVFEQFASQHPAGEDLVGQNRIESDAGREVRHG